MGRRRWVPGRTRYDDVSYIFLDCYGRVRFPFGTRVYPGGGKLLITVTSDRFSEDAHKVN